MKIYRSSTTLTDQSFSGTVNVGDIVVQDTANSWKRRTTETSGLALVVATTSAGIVVTTHGHAPLAGAVAGTTYYLPTSGFTLTTTPTSPASAYPYGVGKKADVNEDVGLHITRTDAQGKLGGAGFQNDLGYNAVSGKIEQGFPLTKNTTTSQSGFFRQFTGSGATTTFDSTGDVNISTTATATTPNTSAGNNARFYVRGGASVFDNAGVDGNEIVEFKTDRSWSIYQRGTAGGTKTQLMSNFDSKTFTVADQTNEDIATFISAGLSNLSAFRVDKSFVLKAVSVSTSTVIDDNNSIFVYNTTGGTINFTLPSVAVSSGRRLIFTKSAGGAIPATWSTSGGQFVLRGGIGLATYTEQLPSSRYTVEMFCDGANWVVEDENVETTRLITVPSQTRTIVGGNSAANARVTIEAAQVLIGSTTFTNTKSVPVHLIVMGNTNINISYGTTGNYSIRPRFAISNSLMDQYQVTGGFFTTGTMNVKSGFISSRLSVAAGATVNIDFSAYLNTVDASVVGTIGGIIGFTEIQLLVVNQ